MCLQTMVDFLSSLKRNSLFLSGVVVNIWSGEEIETIRLSIHSTIYTFDYHPRDFCHATGKCTNSYIVLCIYKKDVFDTVTNMWSYN